MSSAQILVVEDESDILELVTYNLTKEGYEVIGVTSGEEGLRAARREKPDLVVLDLMLPSMDGLDVCKTLRGDPATADLAIVMLTAKGEESDIVVGLELGADDYLTKPFSPKVLIAHIRAVLRRRQGAPESPPPEDRQVIRIHDLAIHPGRREVLVKGRPVELTATEFGLLHYLARRPGWVFTRNQILEAVRGHDAVVTDRAVDVQVVGLRKKLGKSGHLIETVRGVGYRFKE
jgi:two-component system phosphate regulon response regulator PhoB